MSDVYLTGSTALVAQLQSERAKVKALREALEDAQKRLRGAGMLGGASDPVNAALAATSDPIEAPSDVHPTESGQ